MSFGHPYPRGLMNTLDPISTAPTRLIIGDFEAGFYISQKPKDVHNMGSSGPHTKD